MSQSGAPPPSADPPPAPIGAPGTAGGPPAFIERVLQDLQDAGVAPSAIERAVSFWKRFGGRRAAMLTLAVTLPLIRYEYIPRVLSTTVETMAEAYGVRLTVRDWETSFTDIKIVGRDVEIVTAGPYREKRLFRANAVEFDWSLMRALSGAYTRLTTCWTAVIGRACTLPEEVFHRVTIDGATLHLERSLAGAWNTEDAFRVESLDTLSRAMARVRIPSIEGEDVSVSWVEHLPGESGGGLVEQRFSSMDFTKVSLSLAQLQVPVDERENGTRFTFDGQTADGTVSVAGQVNVGRWAAGRWAPSYDLTFRLVNVGAATFGRFAAPDASILPTAGRVDGQIRLAREGNRLTACTVQVQLRDVTYGANPRSPFAQASGSALDAQLSPLRINDVVDRDCTVVGGERVQRASQTLQTIVTTGALQTAPPIVRGAASYDQASVVEGRAPTAEEVTAAVSASLGQKIGGNTGVAVARALTTSPSGSGGNVVSRGARSVGRGIKRLFGGGDTKKPRP
ncbi:MAG: hypothetical protein JNL48_07520 [Acidobacteria bacterium]|nr:hypothetical protein [Acidobacteriota bacterium]